MTSIVARTLVSSAAAVAARGRSGSGSGSRAAASAAVVRTRRSSTIMGGVPTATHFHRNRRDLSAASSDYSAAAAAASGSGGGLMELVTKKNADNVVMVWSKSWCPFCMQAGPYHSGVIDPRALSPPGLLAQDLSSASLGIHPGVIPAPGLIPWPNPGPGLIPGPCGIHH